MPHLSKRGALLSMAELVILFGKSKPTIERQVAALRKTGRAPHVEKVTERHATGAAKVSYYDPATLGWEIPGGSLHQS